MPSTSIHRASKPMARAEALAAAQALRCRLEDGGGRAQDWQKLAALLVQAGRHLEAAEAFARAATAGASIAALALPWASALSSSGRNEAAAQLLSTARTKLPTDFSLANAHGVMLKRAGHLEAATEALQAARRIEPRNAAACQNLGNVLELRGDIAGAAAAFGEGVKLDPYSSELWRLRARMLQQLEDREGAIGAYERSFALDPCNRAVAMMLSQLLIDAGDREGALRVVERLRQHVPNEPASDMVQARLLLRVGRVADAIALLDAVVARNPGHREANVLLARIHGDGDRRKANEALERALAAAPDDPDLIDQLIESLSRSRYGSEVAHLERAYLLAQRLVERHPEIAQRFARSLRTVFQRVLDLPRLAATGTLDTLGPMWIAAGRISALHYELGTVDTLEERLRIVEWHRRWGAELGKAIRPVVMPPRPAIHPGRKLRVGFMSSDLRHHPVTYFALPLLEQYDRNRVQVFCYSFYEGERDGVQGMIEQRVDAFRWWPRKPSPDVARDIAQDGLDILFELGGTTAMNKLDVMAYRPARLGASWLGYPHSAGLATIDYILTDPYVRPVDPRLLIEKSFEMPDSWVALSRLGFYDQMPIEDGTPEERLGRLTFGTMNNPYKFTPACIDAWAAVLRAVQGSRFLFVRPEGSAASFQANARSAFAARDVDPDRLDFVGVRGKHLPHYNAIDIALDSLPHVGGTTTCEALWMGVPTITLVGMGFPERLSYSNLNNAGLGECCAFSVDEYVQKAMALAEDRAKRLMWRRDLRKMIRANPLGNTQRFVDAFYAKAAEVCA